MKVTHTYNLKPCVMFHDEFSFSSIDTKPYIAFNELIMKMVIKFGLPTNDSKLESDIGNFKFKTFFSSYIKKALKHIISSQTNFLSVYYIDKMCLTDYLITFDDALYQQHEVIKRCSEKTSNDIIVFPSGHLLREHNDICIEKNEIAHRNYHKDFKPPYPSTFMSSTEVWDLLSTKVKIGIHGWYHLYVGEDKGNHSGNLKHAMEILYPNLEYKTVNIIKLLKEDAQKSIEWYITNLEINDRYKYYINNGKLVLYYCTPFNAKGYYQDIYIEFLKEYLKKDKFLLSLNYDIHLEIFSNERIKPKDLVKN